MDMFDIGEQFGSLEDGMARITCPTLVIGVQSDILFPITQQKEIVSLLKGTGNQRVTYYELDALYGHDTFLIDVVGVGDAVKGHLELANPNRSLTRQRRPYSEEDYATYSI
jgi:homoserine O-acetyltransferase